MNIGLKWDKQLSAICSLSIFASSCYYKFLCQSEVKRIFIKLLFVRIYKSFYQCNYVDFGVNDMR